jgi:phytoene desaturase
MTAPLRHPLETGSARPHAVVIGAGFGGLAMAIRLGAMGYRVSVFEKNEQAGGRASVYRQDGFSFDAGPTIVTAPHLLDELWETAGRRFADDVTLVPMQPFYQIRFDDGSVINCSGSREAMRAEVKRLSPEDSEGYERFMAWSEHTFQIGFQKLGNLPFNSIWDMAKAVPEIMALGGMRSIFNKVASFFKDHRLKVAFSFHPLFIGGNPLTASAVYGLVAHLEHLWGVHFVMGGTGALVQGMADLIARQGNRIHTNTTIAEILTDGTNATGVRLASGEEIAASIVACNADAGWAYNNLLPKSVRKPLWSLRYAKASYTNGIFIWYFGTNRRYEEVQHHSIVLGPRYEGLLKDIYTHKKLSEDFSLYLYRPTATDPSLAPEGCDAFYVLAPVPHLGSGTDWTTMAEPYKLAVQKRLEETLLPGLGEAIVSSKVMTPLDFKDRFLSPWGAGFGMEPILSQSAYFRPQNKSHWLGNLFMVGAGTHPGAGIPGVLTSAKIAADMVPDPSVFAGAGT